MTQPWNVSSHTSVNIGNFFKIFNILIIVILVILIPLTLTGIKWLLRNCSSDLHAPIFHCVYLKFKESGKKKRKKKTMFNIMIFKLQIHNKYCSIVMIVNGKEMKTFTGNLHWVYLLMIFCIKGCDTIVKTPRDSGYKSSSSSASNYHYI